MAGVVIAQCPSQRYRPRILSAAIASSRGPALYLFGIREVFGCADAAAGEMFDYKRVTESGLTLNSALFFGVGHRALGHCIPDRLLWV